MFLAALLFSENLGLVLRGAVLSTLPPRAPSWFSMWIEPRTLAVDVPMRVLRYYCVAASVEP